ncbi:MAG: ketosteroid isomerase family protein [Leptolyngbyaceae cyanobacterium]
MVTAGKRSGKVQWEKFKDESVVTSYFEHFNAGEFEQAAHLFTPEGMLQPPFEEPVVSPTAIAQYLKSQAKGMQAFPKEVELDDASAPQLCQVVVRGQVTAVVFKVNAAWIFELSPTGQIQHLRVKLLATMQELLNLRDPHAKPE